MKTPPGCVPAFRGKLEEEIDKYEEGLAVDRRALRPEHPDVARTLYNMAVCKVKIGEGHRTGWRRTSVPTLRGWKVGCEGGWTLLGDR